MSKKKITEMEIDQIVISQADDELAWGNPTRVRRTEPISVPIPAELAAGAAFLAQLHQKKSLKEWITNIIQERIELEEAAFIGVKQDLSFKAG